MLITEKKLRSIIKNVIMSEGRIADLYTNKGHEKWRSDYMSTKGNTPRFKPIPGNYSYEDLTSKGYKGLSMIDNVLNQDINQPASDIFPDLNYKLNGAAAVHYEKILESASINSIEDIELLASKFHDIWMQVNSWQKDSAPQLFVSYEALTPDEKLKDIQQVALGIEDIYGVNSFEMDLVNQAMSECC